MACWAWTPSIGSPANGRRPGRSTPVRERLANRGTTPSDGPGWPRRRHRSGCRSRSRHTSPSWRRTSPHSGRRTTAAAASLDGLDLEVRALATDQSFAAIHESRAAELAKREAEVNAGRSREAVLADSILAGRRELDRLRAGDLGDPRVHLHGDHHPVPPEMTRYGRIVEIWAAISISLVLVGMVAIVWFTPVRWYVALVAAFAFYAVLEAAFRRRLTTLLLRTTLVLAGLGALILLYEFTTPLVMAAIIGLAALTLFDNVREIRRVPYGADQRGS